MLALNRLGESGKVLRKIRVLDTAVILCFHFDELHELNKLVDPWVKNAVLIR